MEEITSKISNISLKRKRVQWQEIQIRKLKSKEPPIKKQKFQKKHEEQLSVYLKEKNELENNIKTIP